MVLCVHNIIRTLLGLQFITTFGAREVVYFLGFPQIRFVSVAYVKSHRSEIGECPFTVFARLSFC